MASEALAAPPRRWAALGSVNSAQVWRMPVSSFLKVTVKSLPAGTARQVWANPLTLAPTAAVTVMLLLPVGRHDAPAEGLALGDDPGDWGPGDGPTGANCGPPAAAGMVFVDSGGV